MALIISLKRGEDLYVEDDRLVVTEIREDGSCLVSTDKGDFEVVDDQMVEVFPDVFVSAGNRAHIYTVRLAVDAPREKVILRGTKYRERLEDQRRELAG
jgi:sRNA-binding carbon storage regulator CsrA